MFQKWFRFSLDRLDRDIGELDPMPDTAFPRRNYGICGSRLDLLKHYSPPGAVEIIQRDMKSVVHYVVEVTDRPRVHPKLRDFLEKENVETASSVPPTIAPRVHRLA
jgi:hypothetical protein